MPEQYKPNGYTAVSPYLVVSDIAKLIEFLDLVFDGAVTEKIVDPEGNIMHAEFTIDDAVIMIGRRRAGADELVSTLYVYVPDVDDTYNNAIGKGAKSVRRPEDQFYGDRSAGFIGPMGNHWWVATHIEKVSEDERNRRLRQMHEENE